MIIENIQVSSAIKRILEKELKRGNSIAETSTGWPSKNSLLIILDKPFQKRYHWTCLHYKNINDSHYWKEEYIDDKNDQILACKF